MNVGQSLDKKNRKKKRKEIHAQVPPKETKILREGDASPFRHGIVTKMDPEGHGTRGEDLSESRRRIAARTGCWKSQTARKHVGTDISPLRAAADRPPLLPFWIVLPRDSGGRLSAVFSVRPTLVNYARQGDAT